MSDDMGSGIAKTFLKAFAWIGAGAAALAGIFYVAIRATNTPEEKKTYQYGFYTVDPLERRVFEKLSPTFGRTTDFRSFKIYDVTINGKDTTHTKNQPMNVDSMSEGDKKMVDTHYTYLNTASADMYMNRR